MPKKKTNKNKKVYRESELGMILEENRKHFKILRESQDLLKNELKSTKSELKEKISEVKTELKEEIKILEKKTDDGFKLIMQHLSRLEDEVLEVKKELRNKINKKDFNPKNFRVLERKVIHLEAKIEKFEKMLKKAKVV